MNGQVAEIGQLIDAEIKKLSTATIQGKLVPCASGTFNDVTIDISNETCKSQVSFSGSYSAGSIQSQYTGYVDNFQNLFNFAVGENPVYDVAETGSDTIQLSIGFELTYYTPVQVSGNVQVEIQDCTNMTCTGCNRPCYMNCACGLSTGPCTVCTGYNSAENATWEGVVDNPLAMGTVSVTVSYNNPGTTTDITTVQIAGATPCYIYNISMSNLTINSTGGSATCSIDQATDIPISSSDMSTIIGIIEPLLQSLFNEEFSDMVFQIVV